MHETKVGERETEREREEQKGVVLLALDALCILSTPLSPAHPPPSPRTPGMNGGNQNKCPAGPIGRGSPALPNY